MRVVISTLLISITVAAPTLIMAQDSLIVPSVWQRADRVMETLCPSAAKHRKNMDVFGVEGNVGRNEAIATANTAKRCGDSAHGLDRARLYAEAVAAYHTIHSVDSDMMKSIHAKEVALIHQALPLAKPDKELVETLHSFEDQMP